MGSDPEKQSEENCHACDSMRLCFMRYRRAQSTTLQKTRYHEHAATQAVPLQKKGSHFLLPACVPEEIQRKGPLSDQEEEQMNCPFYPLEAHALLQQR